MLSLSLSSLTIPPPLTQPQPGKYNFQLSESRISYALVDEGVCYGCIAGSGVQASAALLMLAELRSDFHAQFSSAEREQGLVADDTTAFRRFSATIRRSMEGAYLGGQQKVDMVKSQVAETKMVMSDNIEKVLQRGEDLDTVVEKTDRMVDSANIFKKKGVQIRKRLWWQNMRIKLLIAAAVLLVLIILFFVICRGVACVT